MRRPSLLEAALYVTDLSAAETFYRDVLGLDLLSKVEGRHVFFRCDEAVLLLFDAGATAEPPAPGSNFPVPPHGALGSGHACFAASADDIAAWKTHLEGQGVPIEADFPWPGGGRSIYFRDPSGNSLEFAEPRIWGF